MSQTQENREEPLEKESLALIAITSSLKFLGDVTSALILAYIVILLMVKCRETGNKLLMLTAFSYTLLIISHILMVLGAVTGTLTLYVLGRSAQANSIHNNTNGNSKDG